MKLIILGLIILIISVIIYFSNKRICEGVATIGSQNVASQNPGHDFHYIKIDGNRENIEDKALKLKCGDREITVDTSVSGNVVDVPGITNGKQVTVIRLPPGVDPKDCHTSFKQRRLDEQKNEICDIHSAGESNDWYCSGWSEADRKGTFSNLEKFNATNETDCLNQCTAKHSDKFNHECQKGDYLPEISEQDTNCSSVETSNLGFAGITIAQWKNLSNKGTEDYIKWINKGGGEPIVDMDSTALNLPLVTSQRVLNKTDVENYLNEIRGTGDINFGGPNVRTGKSLLKSDCWDYNYFNNSFSSIKRKLVTEWPPPSINDPVWHRQMCDARLATKSYEVFATGYGKRDDEKWGEFKDCCQFNYSGDKNRGPYSNNPTSDEAKGLYEKCNEAKTCVDNKGGGATAVTECEENSPIGGYSKGAYSVGIKLAEGPTLGIQRKQRICEAKVNEARTKNPEKVGRDQDVTTFDLGEYSSWGDFRNCCQFGIGGSFGRGPLSYDDREKLVDACIIGENGQPIEMLPADSTNEEKGAWRVGKRLSLNLGSVKENKLNEWKGFLSNIKNESSGQQDSLDSLKQIVDIPLPNINNDEKNFMLNDSWVNNFLSTFETRKQEYSKKNMKCTKWSGEKVRNVTHDGCDLENENNMKICGNSLYGTNTGNGEFDGDGNRIGTFRVKDQGQGFVSECKFLCSQQLANSEGADWGNATYYNSRLQCDENVWKGATEEYEQDQENKRKAQVEQLNTTSTSRAEVDENAAARSRRISKDANANGQQCTSSGFSKIGAYGGIKDFYFSRPNGSTNRAAETLNLCQHNHSRYRGQKYCYYQHTGPDENQNTIYYGTTRKWAGYSDCIDQHGGLVQNTYTGAAEANCTRC